MADRFSKLDFLMELTGSRNSALSKAVSFDPSHISRIRSGLRRMPKSREFLDSAASFFVKRIRTAEQISALSAALGEEVTVPEDKSELTRVLASWLEQEEQILPERQEPVGNFLDRLSAAGFSARTPSSELLYGKNAAEIDEAISRRTEQISEETPSGRFYGNEGKRRAVELFLGRLVQKGKPCELLLFSDEDMSWLYEDPAFSRRWAGLLLRLLAAGSHITIPHTLSRDSGEMFEAVSKWLPLYMTGGISPYYCPRLRDRIYRRSLFLAQGSSAVISCSVGRHTDGMLNLYLEDKEAVHALELEYHEYLNLCRPLMRILRPGRTDECLLSLLRFEQGNAPLLSAHTLPLAFTMPQKLLRVLKQRTVPGAFFEYQARSAALCRSYLRNGGSITEILNLPDAEKVCREGVLLPIGNLLDAPGVQLSARDLADHLSGVIRLLRRESSYRVVLSSEVPPNVIVQVREGEGVRFACCGPSSILFELSEPNLTAAFYDYLTQAAEQSPVMEREAVIKELRAYIGKLTTCPQDRFGVR